MEIASFIAGTIFGAVIGYCIEKILDALGERVFSLRKRQYWQQAHRTWKKYESLSYGLEVIQTGWKDGAFSEDQVVLTVDSTFELPREIASNIRDRHIQEWETNNLTNNQQYGIAAIDPRRISDEVAFQGSTSHELRIHGHICKYFDFLSTHRCLLPNAPQDDRLFIESILQRHGRHYLEPAPEFPNQLSIGLSLFCEKGNCLVLTRRTKLPSSGGLWFGDTIFNAVGEMMTPTDTDSNNSQYEGSTRLSPWTTAKRGLFEEVGIRFQKGTDWIIVLHSLAWDNRILDYKFFGHIITPLSRGDVKQHWMAAPDRHESWELIFFDTSNKEQCLEIVRMIDEQRSDWASEGILCTIRSLLHLRKITPDELKRALK